MSDRPIVLTADEVRETLTGRMSHILRPITINPYDGAFYLLDGWPHRSKDGESPRIDGKAEPYPCPGAVGDRLWVRETWRSERRNDGARMVRYASDSGLFQVGHDVADWHKGLTDRWRSSTSMPRWAARLVLNVVAVRVQRLQEVAEEQAQAAGIPFHIDAELARWEKDGRLWHGRTRLVNYYARRLTPTIEHHFKARLALADWWRETWDTNPWIWDITFKRVEQE